MGGSLRERLAAAPITWGVCEVPGWGYQLSPEYVLSDMAAIGFTHTELGPVGFLPADGEELARLLSQHGLSLLGGFVAVVLHDSVRLEAELTRVASVVDQMASAGGTWFISCPISDHDSWQRPPLDDAQWDQMFRGFAAIDDIAARAGLHHAFHPHVGALVQDDVETRAVLEHTDTQLVLDTAHLTLGGTDPAALARSHRDRIGLVHLKDVDAGVARRLRSGQLTLMAAVQRGLFPPLGHGAVPLAEIIETLEHDASETWYVLEQDAALSGPDARAVERLRSDVARSLEFVQQCEAALRRPGG
ncbi:sugar phosphate isomerase/epimerase family protein [Candidatus Poriferisodalis sp.]|uniref:sugar phosphate isomerase/epimerase family protein n=1 Tax=Candidatus Poriferisodalis sp. TaxID=3101277 RepID=UPI003B01044A